jgi:hypothetical protein
MNKKILIPVLLLLAAFAGWYIYREYNRTNTDLAGVSADYSLPATELIASFEKDTASAGRKYTDKVISVTGNVKSVDADGNPVVIALGDAGQMSSVQCSMDSTHAKDYAGTKEGDQLTIKGMCTGGKTEELFGTDVMLNRCVVEK